MKVLAIIPAKMDSTRLVGKNMKDINGKPLLEYSIEYAQDSQYDIDIIVTSESDEVKEFIENFVDVQFLHRPLELCGDAEVVDVYIDVVDQTMRRYDLVVGLQPDNPNRANTLDECIKYMLDNNYDDLVTINPEFKRSGSVRIFKWIDIKKGRVSKRVGAIYDDAMDIHTQEDLDYVRGLLDVQ